MVTIYSEEQAKFCLANCNSLACLKRQTERAKMLQTKQKYVSLQL